MQNKLIGIDAGGSLVKIAYEEKGQFKYKKYLVSELEKAISWLKITAPDAMFKVTGGKAGLIQSAFIKEAVVVPEFEAVCAGAVFLMKEAAIYVNNFLLVNIGTGTSFYLLDGEKNNRLLGSGVGGGTLVGLGSLLTGVSDFQSLVRLSGEGDKGNVDLLVKDIYEPHEPPIEGSLTASNFAKAYQVHNGTDADKMASVSNMIAETLILLSMQAATLHKVSDVVFVGTTLAGNKPLQKGLQYYSEMLGLNAIFLKNGEFSGAVGAILKN